MGQSTKPRRTHGQTHSRTHARAPSKDDTYYAAMLARDHRFDGKFFVGVKTTGIYCRPICPAKPKRENVEFFAHHYQAEGAGYRPCLRCRPESAPRSAVWIGTSAVVRRALKLVSRPEALTLDEARFAAQLGITARHLRRLFIAEIGKTPRQIVLENRLNLARKLIVETSLPITEVAFSAGFASIRRFNDAFKIRFHQKPSAIRRQRQPERAPLRISLPYRPPFDFAALLKSYRTHRIGELEHFTDTHMYRVVSFGGEVGEIAIEDDAVSSCLRVSIDFPRPAAIHSIIARVREMFDLDLDPLVIANHFEADAGLQKLLAQHPGLRLPSGWDAFEIAVGTILGQLVSVERARGLVADLIELTGTPSTWLRDGRPVKLFPTPAQLAAADLSALKTTGVRRATLREFARQVAEGTLSLDAAQDVDSFVTQLRAIRGIGPWTATYMAMKVLRYTDAFPHTDLILARALERHPLEAVAKMSPWRGYVAALLWREYTEVLSKAKARSKPKSKLKSNPKSESKSKLNG